MAMASEETDDFEPGLGLSQTRSSLTLTEARLPEPSLASHSSATAELSGDSGSGSGSGSDSNGGDGAEVLSAEEGGFFYFPDFISEQEEEYLLQQIHDAPALKWKTLQNRSGRTLGRLQTWGGQLAGSNGNTLIPQPLPSFFTSFPDLIQRLADTGAFRGSKHGEANHCLVNEYLSGQGIMPHEDGGAYFPAVATISLGSHTVLDIYRYAVDPASEADDAAAAAALKEDGEGSTKTTPAAAGPDPPSARAREKDPAFSILQERRSLLITLGPAYRKYLHGIAERQSDEYDHLKSVINLDRLGDPVLKERVEQVLKEGSTDTTAKPALDSIAESEESEESTTPLRGLVRDTRVSLTFRDVEKVSMGLQKLLGRGGGKR
ncbi:unnamed protein product [Tilletia laevis]|nr:unnamed protein product [Tilletia laevis]